MELLVLLVVVVLDTGGLDIVDEDIVEIMIGPVDDDEAGMHSSALCLIACKKTNAHILCSKLCCLCSKQARSS